MQQNLNLELKLLENLKKMGWPTLVLRAQLKCGYNTTSLIYGPIYNELSYTFEYVRSQA